MGFAVTTRVLAASIALIGTQAQALPLLAESAALRAGNALTLYPDHQDPNKFYFMPNSSRIGRDQRGVPTFSFTYYGLDKGDLSQAGALMVYVGRLASDNDQAQALSHFLRTNPRAGVAVLPIRESIVTLNSTTGQTPLKPLFSEFNFAAKGGRAEDEIGINAILTGIGAKLFKASLLAEVGAALKYDMCYKVQGLGPAMDGKIFVRMDRVYDHFKASASGGFLWWRASINTEIEKLWKSKAVNWEINGGDAKDEDYIREATRMIVERMFKPEIAMGPSSGSSTVWDRATPFTFGGTYTRREEHDVETWTVKKRSLVENEYCLPLTIKDIQDYRNQCVVNADTL